ncbi:hypothetical protein EJ06DRAFT_521838 [Trichodelitschia bisporula]|uniref:Uncharacterized protein n=1 Tax=Trichodelitschia bisporula TaxID=703511 RepID=A0A6G1HWE5_9PEZI|nr:hypothetical protein EJ06DRAFT_521838 [Trichodelitschia bisporula]
MSSFNQLCSGQGNCSEGRHRNLARPPTPSKFDNFNAYATYIIWCFRMLDAPLAQDILDNIEPETTPTDLTAVLPPPSWSSSEQTDDWVGDYQSDRVTQTEDVDLKSAQATIRHKLMGVLHRAIHTEEQRISEVLDKLVKAEGDNIVRYQRQWQEAYVSQNCYKNSKTALIGLEGSA